jgi:PAS domain-containing protein
MNLVILAEDLGALVAFGVALVVALTIPARAGRLYGSSAKGFFAAAFASYLVLFSLSVFDGVAFVSQHLLVLEDSAELLFAPFLVAGVYALYARQEAGDALAASRTAAWTGDMMARIMATTPAGILVVDASGWITEANAAARTLLELSEDPDLGTVMTPGWRVRVGEPVSAPVRDDLSVFVVPEVFVSVPTVIEWPDGRRIRLSVSSEPMRNVEGDVTGGVISFVVSEPWRPTPR